MKKLLSVVLTCIFIFSFAVPVFASSQQIDPVTGLPLDIALFSDAYTNFTIILDDMNIIPMTSIEEFVSNYIDGTYSNIDQYVNHMVTLEILWAENNTINYLNYISVADYPVTYGTSGAEWYDNIITEEGIELGRQPIYSIYNIKSQVSPGDIIQETEGLLTAITGHIAIVQGNYYDRDHLMYYTRTIEANSYGVVYGVLDDQRFNARGARVYHVTNASEEQILGAINFCEEQIGKPYNYDGLNGNLLRCQYAETTTKWYCTELVWAAYYNQGINLYVWGEIPGNIYMPAQMGISPLLERRNIS